MGDVGAGDVGVGGRGFEGDDQAVIGERAGEPDGGVAAEGADLEDASGAGGACEEVEELALGRRDVDGGQAGGGVGRQDGVEDRVGREELAGDEVVDVSRGWGRDGCAP